MEPGQAAAIIASIAALITAAVGWVKNRQDKRAGVRTQEREDEAYERDRRRRAEARVRVLDDYAHCLRRQVTDLGGVPAPWPDSQTDT